MTVTLETRVSCPYCKHKIRFFTVATVRVNKRSMRTTGSSVMLGAFEDWRCPGCRVEIPRDGALEREPYRLTAKDAVRVAEYRKAKWGIEGAGVDVERVAGMSAPLAGQPRAVYRGYYGGKRAGQVRRLHIIREEGPAGSPPGSQTMCGQSAGRHQNSDPVIISPLPSRPPEGLAWCPSCVGKQAELSGLLGGDRGERGCLRSGADDVSASGGGVAAGRAYMPRTARTTVAVPSKETHLPVYLQFCRRAATTASPDRDSAHQSPTCGFVGKPRQLLTDAIASRPVNAELVERFRHAHARVEQQLHLQGERWQVRQGERFQFRCPDRRAAGTFGHARPDELGEIRAHRVLVVPAAERPPADVLAGRVVFQRPGRPAAGHGAVCPPLAVALAASVQGRRPVISSAVLGVGKAKATGHAGKSPLVRGVAAGSEGIMSTLLEGSEAGPAFVLADGAGFAAYLAGSVLAGLAGSAPALRWPSCLRGRYSCRARQLTHVRRREGREFRDRRRWHAIAEGVKYGGYRFIACTPAGVVNLDVTTCGRLERGHVLGFVHAANTIATNLRLSSVRISMGDMRKAMTQASTRNIKVG